MCVNVCEYVCVCVVGCVCMCEGVCGQSSEDPARGELGRVCECVWMSVCVRQYENGDIGRYHPFKSSYPV